MLRSLCPSLRAGTQLARLGDRAWTEFNLGDLFVVRGLELDCGESRCVPRRVYMMEVLRMPFAETLLAKGIAGDACIDGRGMTGVSLGFGFGSCVCLSLTSSLVGLLSKDVSKGSRLASTSPPEFVWGAKVSRKAG